MTFKIDSSASPDVLFAFDDIPNEPKRPAPTTTSTIQPYQPNMDRPASPDVLFQLDDIHVETKHSAPMPQQPKMTLQLKRTPASSPPQEIPIKQESPKKK